MERNLRQYVFKGWATWQLPETCVGIDPSYCFTIVEVIKQLATHGNHVKGVAFDPMGYSLASQVQPSLDGRM